MSKMVTALTRLDLLMEMPVRTFSSELHRAARCVIAFVRSGHEAEVQIHQFLPRAAIRASHQGDLFASQLGGKEDQPSKTRLPALERVRYQRSFYRGQ
jgi:hypothetical protein